NPAFLDYRLPTALDVPPVTPIIVEEPHAEGPYGAKGLGELALAATPACLSNAIFERYRPAAEPAPHEHRADAGARLGAAWG
ncbi:MAG: hypothetical protein HYX89_01075, partial [Chloroflexi bacterium]|nr:hypothetical protein [Chloroflexota bacterium]